MSLRGYATLAKLNIKDTLQYPGALAVNAGMMAVFLFALINVWSTIYAEHPPLQGLSFVSIIWYLFIVELLNVVTLPPSLEIEEEVLSGGIAYQLARPYNYFVFKFVKFFSATIVRACIAGVLGAGIAYSFAGMPSLTMRGLAGTLLVSLLGYVVYFFPRFMIGLLSFWVERIQGLNLVYMSIEVILGGVYFPLEIFSPAVRAVLERLPFASFIYWPAKIFVTQDVALIPPVVKWQLIWIVIFAIMTGVMFRLGVRRVQTHGG